MRTLAFVAAAAMLLQSVAPLPTPTPEHKFRDARPANTWEVLTSAGSTSAQQSLDGPAANASLSLPWGVAVSGDTVYFAEFGGQVRCCPLRSLRALTLTRPASQQCCPLPH